MGDTLRFSDEPEGKEIPVTGELESKDVLLMALANSDSHQLLWHWCGEKEGAPGCIQGWDKARNLLRSLLITHALNISSDVIKAPEIKCLSQAEQAGSSIQIGQDSGKYTQGKNPLASTPTHGS